MNSFKSPQYLKPTAADFQQLDEFLVYRWGKVLVRLSSGYLFGEKALIDSVPRAATAITLTDTELIYIEKKDFEDIKKNYAAMREVKNQLILQIFPFLQDIITSSKVFERLVRFFTEEKFYRHQRVLREGDAYTKKRGRIYFVVNVRAH